jgi:3-oxoacyl-[acyl-carrier-protein] synthase II
MLEAYDFARRRGANIIGEVIGFSCNNNGGDMILPNARGVTEAIRLGLENAGITPDAVDFVSAHATGTKMGDVVEAQAIQKIYGDRPLVCGLKSYMGHTMAACGAIETLLTIYMMQEGFVAPTLNLEEVDRRCAMIRHVTRLQEKAVRIAAIQSFAFGGVNTTVLVKKFE